MKNKGFTLLELSIVLVVIGLVIGGVVVSQVLVRQSQLIGMMTEVQKYIQATNTFKVKYNAVPGDFSRTSSFWTTAGTCPPTYAAPLTGNNTCSGDGNGHVDYVTAESILFWNHLFNANLISGFYNGAPGTGGSYHHVPDTNCPSSKMEGMAFGAVWQGPTASDSNYFDGDYGHVIIAGGKSSNNLPLWGGITPNEALEFDKKFDDGKVAYGQVVSFKNGGFFTDCATTAVSATAEYDISSTTFKCPLIFIAGF